MNKTLLAMLSGLVVLVILIFGIRFLAGDEDTWICDNGKWVKHGVPTSPAPNEPCPGSQYIWSTMNEGPYKDKISFATSDDLLQWTDSKNILASHASVPSAIYNNGVIYLYFVDVSQDGVAERIGLITSDDNGETWSNKQFANFTGINYEVPVDPAPYLLDDGRIRMYYFDIEENRNLGPLADKSTNKIYSVISNDGVNFNKEVGVRFEAVNIFDPDVVKVENNWRMYVGSSDGNSVLSATSSDGLSFTEEGTAFEGGAIPDVLYENGTYFLFTGGIDISTSTGGSSFVKIGSGFRSDIGTLTADPSVIQLDDGSYMMFYKTRDE